MISGCASSNPNAGGITTRAYVADKDREDQTIQGNQGYLMGTPKAEDRSNLSKTRKVYVVEFTKEIPEENNGSLIPPARPKPARAAVQPQAVQEPDWNKPVNLPPIESVRVEKKAADDGACQEYVVKKGDTLQKISKKMYGSYAKWHKIYEANKDKLADPDHLKAGMKLCVPGGAAKEAPAVKETTENLK
jgi:nucleoid-associated protein YgaU